MPSRPLHTLPLSLLTLWLLVAACRVTPPELGADAGALEPGVDADAPGCGLSAQSSAAQGLLWLANHGSPEELAAGLPLGAGLAPSVAGAIAGAQPIASIGELDGLREVDSQACQRLQDFACEGLGRCEDPLELVTWNLKSFPLSADTPAEVRRALREMGADIVGLQEIENTTSFYDMRDAMPDYEGLVGHKGYATRVAILYKPERLEVVAIDDLFEDDRYAFPRPPLAVTFALHGRAATERFTVVVVHLKAMADSQSVARRRLAVDRLGQWMAGQAVQSIFVLGDFNDRVTDPPDDDVFGSLRSTDYRILTEDIAQSGGYSYIRYASLIDHSVATAAATRMLPMQSSEAPAIEESVLDYQDRVSDHRPVVTEHRPILPAIESRLSALPW